MTARIDIKSIRRQQVVRAVRRIIATDGLDAVTIERIARQAGLSRGVVTYHFRGKREILHEVLTAAMREANRAAATLVTDGNLAEDLAQLTARVTELAVTGHNWWRIYVEFLAKAPTSEFYRSELSAVDQYYTKTLERIVGNPAQATILLALMRGLALLVIVKKDLSLEDVTEEIARLLKGWAAGPAEPGPRESDA